MSEAPHIPVLLREVLEAASPVTGVWIDGTLGAGGYTRALLDAGAEHVIGIDRDPDARTAAAAWGRAYEGRLTVADGTFSGLAAIARDAGFAHV
ncbi:MAG: 16S rRNA (cytosine(1402)-N(4))-methyltransferase, partial [Rubricella sp.]